VSGWVGCSAWRTARNGCATKSVEIKLVSRKGTKAGRGRNGGGKVKTCRLPDRVPEMLGAGGAGATEGCGARLFQAIGAAAEEFEEAEVAEDLELLADFVANMAIGGMQFGKL